MEVYIYRRSFVHLSKKASIQFNQITLTKTLARCSSRLSPSHSSSLSRHPPPRSRREATDSNRLRRCVATRALMTRPAMTGLVSSLCYDLWVSHADELLLQCVQHKYKSGTCHFYLWVLYSDNFYDLILYFLPYHLIFISTIFANSFPLLSTAATLWSVTARTRQSEKKILNWDPSVETLKVLNWIEEWHHAELAMSVFIHSRYDILGN